MTLKGKTALVTGSTSGIGLGIALSLAEAGADLLLNGFGEVDAALAQVRARGVRAEHHPADLSSPEQIGELMAFAERTFGGVDILVNNAGIQYVAPVQEFPTERWDAIIAINLSSVFHTTRLALPGMLARGWGRIVNIASTHGLVASAGKSAYVAAKHGVLGLTKSVALETARTPVTCNAICPGWVLTPLVQKQIDARIAEGVSPEQAEHDLLAEKQPSLAFVTPRATRRTDAVPLQRSRRPGARRGLEHGWRLGGAVAGAASLSPDPLPEGRGNHPEFARPIA